MIDFPIPVLSLKTLQPGVVVLEISGDLDTRGTQSIESAFRAALADQTQTAIINLLNVRIVTSAALAMFLVTAQSMNRRGGKMELVTNRMVAETFVRAGCSSLFKFHTSLEQAMYNFKQRR